MFPNALQLDVQQILIRNKTIMLRFSKSSLNLLNYRKHEITVGLLENMVIRLEEGKDI